MPTARNYNGGSIVYFQGDTGDEVYVLQKGKVALISTALDTGEEIKEEVRLGEFFGVKSALGRYPREETAQVIGKTSVLVFKLPEFEAFCLKNTHLIMKMLRVFSKQLRSIHRQVRDILKVGAAKDPGYELMNVAECFYKAGSVDHAVYAFGKYAEHYPGGPYTARASELLQMARKGMTFPIHYPPLEVISSHARQDDHFVHVGMQSADKAADDPFALDAHETPAAAEKTITDIFYEGLNHYGQGQYAEALASFEDAMSRTTLRNQEESDSFAKAHYEKGRAELKLGKLDDATTSFSVYLKKFPTGDQVKESIFHMGVTAEMKGNKERARTLYHKVATMPPPDDVTREARKRLEKMA
ncbi:MAG: cyclic nucleotide-binding domain-containing protein [Spirochaetia bacterium]|nr:cyclic nucleotide-binding domain-containing protein [Spirochaetia bacterium]